MISDIDFLQFGWEKNDRGLLPVSTADEIAPEFLVSLVSCNCKRECDSNRCSCKKNNVACTDFCGCGELCQNTDGKPNLDGETEEELGENDIEAENSSEDELDEMESVELSDSDDIIELN